MLPFPLDKYNLLLPHKEPDQTSRGKKHLKPRSKLHKQEREGKADGRSLRSDRGVEQAGYGRADLPLGLGGHCSSRCRQSLSEVLPLRFLSVYSLPCFSLTVCPPKDGKHGYSSPSEPHSPLLPPPNGDLYAPPGLAEEIQKGNSDWTA